MKNKILPILFLMVVIVGCIWSIKRYISRDDYKEKAVVKSDVATEVLRCGVYSGQIERKLQYKGIVVNRYPEGYIMIAEHYDTDAIISCKKVVGDDVEKGDVIFTIGNKEYKSPVIGVVTDVTLRGDCISYSILDYDSLFIDVKIDYEYLDFFTIGTGVDVVWKRSDKDLAFTEKVSGRAFEISDNMIDVYLSNTNHYLPGMTFDVSLKYVTEAPSMYTLRQMVMEDASGTYVYKLVDGERQRQIVEIGDTFVISDGGVATEFIEIISGVSTEDKLIIDVIQER